MRRLSSILKLAVLCALAAGICPSQSSGRQIPANPHGRLPPGIDCSACHRTGGWSALKDSLDFDHLATTRFALVDRHASARCVACHPKARFDEPGSDACSNCHADIHQGQLGEECSACHSTRGFDDVDGTAIHLRTSFPLTGAHLQIACEACHRDDRGGAFSPLEPACVTCHEQDYNGAGSIDHREAGFSESCDDCHGTTGWSGSGRFDHVEASGGFELLGAHAVIRCSSCHVTPGFTTRFEAASPEDCIACHAPDFDRAHVGSGFDTACLACHDTDQWSNADFRDHDRVFPIYSGTHRGEWDSCATCHTAPGDRKQFTCIDCHEHDRSGTDRDHDEIGSYVYESSQCYRCHPSGREEEG